jgi:putative endonuclease
VTAEKLLAKTCARPAVYVLACRDGSLYTGATSDLPRRLSAHRGRNGAKYTRGRLPVSLVAWWHPATYAIAKSQEAKFKRLRRAAKLAALRSNEIFGCPVLRFEANGA